MWKTMAVCLALTVALAGCGSKKKDAPKTEEKPAPTASATPAGPAPRPGAPNRPPPVRRQVAPITLDEVKDMVPAIDGARVIKAAQHAQMGERIEAAYCFESTDLAAVAEKVKGTLSGAGWPNLMTRQIPQVQDRIGISGNKAPYVLTGTVQKGTYPDCEKDKNQIYVTFGVHKIITQPGAAPGGPMAPGAPRPNVRVPQPVPAPAPAPQPEQTQ